MTRAVVLRITAVAALVAAVSATVGTQAPRTDVRLAAGHGMWNTINGDVDGDGEDELIIATLDGAGGLNQVTFKTPLYVWSVTGNKVIDRSAELLGTPRPTSWNTTLATGDFDGDGRLDVYLCDRGRNFGPNPPTGDVLVDGVRGAQNEVLLNRDGVLTIADGFPRMVTSSWGCSAGDVDGSGRATIALMSWYSRGHDAAFQLQWDGLSRFVQTRTLLPSGQSGFGATATADFDGNGFADVAGGRTFFLNGPGVPTGSQPLAQSTVERLGYTFWRTTLTADFTGDGLADLVKFNCLPEPTLAEMRFAMYAGDRTLGLVEKVDAFPAIAGYGFNDHSQRGIALDVNFDGALDIVGMGTTYGVGCQQPRAPGEICTPTQGGEQPPNAVWLNDGTGRFHQARWSDPMQAVTTCTRSEAYFLPTADPKKFKVIWGGCGVGYVGKTVTEADPLTFVP